MSDPIVCEECYEEYDSSHIEDDDPDLIRDCAEFDGWKFGFFTSCKKCVELAAKELEDNPPRKE